MNKTSIVLLIIWIALAIINIVSLFTINTFLLISNYVFGFFNFWIVVALIPQMWGYIFPKKKKELKEE